jgi:uncharacterized membrane protein required for colicin V production
MNVNLLDGILAAILIGAGVLGFRMGPLKKSISLVASIVAVIVGIRLMPPLGGTLARWGIFSGGFSFLLVFLVVAGALLGLSWFLLRRFGPKSAAKKPGRFAAAAVGVAEAAFLISILLLMLKFLDVPDPRTRTGSLLYRPMISLAPWSFDALRTALPEGEQVEEGLTPERPPSP